MAEMPIVDLSTDRVVEDLGVLAAEMAAVHRALGYPSYADPTSADVVSRINALKEIADNVVVVRDSYDSLKWHAAALAASFMAESFAPGAESADYMRGRHDVLREAHTRLQELVGKSRA